MFSKDQLPRHPVAKFVYHSDISLMLGEIIYKASGLRADKFAECYFLPLDIANYSWGKVRMLGTQSALSDQLGLELVPNQKTVEMLVLEKAP